MTDINPETARQILDLPLPADNDADAATIRDYLIKLLSELWREEAGFNSKLPFGNSGWQYDIYVPLIRAGLIAGILDEYDDVSDDFEYRDADKVILAAIAELGRVA
jgi:hypothetical protein